MFGSKSPKEGSVGPDVARFRSCAAKHVLRLNGTRRCEAKELRVDALFFPKDHEPPLNHEYQLLLATDAGRLAFDRSLAVLSAHAR
jgi:hypothetical protein